MGPCKESRECIAGDPYAVAAWFQGNFSEWREVARESGGTPQDHSSR